MSIKRKIRVLIVDDSLLFQQVLKTGLSSDPAIEVIAVAGDPYSASEKIAEFEPDVMTLDVELPRMNGIEFLRRLMPQYPVPVVVVSAVSNTVFEALNAGAVDFVSKAEIKSRNMESFMNELIIKIKIASTAKVGYLKKDTPLSNKIYSQNGDLKNKIIAIGASTGGTEAIYQVLKDLPKEVPGIVIVQHMPPVFTKMYADRLNNSCLLHVKEAENGDMILPGKAIIAAGEFHMKIKKGVNGYFIESFRDEKVNGHCPSVDVLFHSVAEEMGKNGIGVILTGMGYDGAKGLLNMRKKGARTIGQDEGSSVVYGMPKVAYEIGAVERQLPIGGISQAICNIINGSF